MMNRFTKIPIWKTGGVSLLVYLGVLAFLSVFTKADDFWSELIGMPRFRRGFVFYSAPFFAIGCVLGGVGKWVPGTGLLVAIRIGVIVLCVLSLAFAGLLLGAFGMGFDWKLSM